MKIEFGFPGGFLMKWSAGPNVKSSWAGAEVYRAKQSGNDMPKYFSIPSSVFSNSRIKTKAT